jgi:hypothetical protein
MREMDEAEYNRSHYPRVDVARVEHVVEVEEGRVEVEDMVEADVETGNSSPSSSAPSNRPSSPLHNAYNTPPSSPALSLIPPSHIRNSWAPPLRYNPPAPTSTFAVLIPGTRIQYHTSTTFYAAIPPGSYQEHLWFQGYITVWVAVPPGWRGTSVVRDGWRYEIVGPEADGVRDLVLA